MALRVGFVYHYDSTPEREKHFMDIVDDLEKGKSGFTETYAFVNHGDHAIKFVSHSMPEWIGLITEIQRIERLYPDISYEDSD